MRGTEVADEALGWLWRRNDLVISVISRASSLRLEIKS